MPLSRIATFAVASLLTLGVASSLVAQDTSLIDPAIAGMTADQKVGARQSAMKEDGGLLRSAGNLTGAEAVAAADKLIHNYANLPGLFTEDTKGNPNSKALPALFDNLDAFNGIFAAGLKAAQDARAAAEAGDAAAYGAALQIIGGTCGTCHQQFRG